MSAKRLFFLLLIVVVVFGLYLILREPPAPVLTGQQSAQGVAPIILVQEAAPSVANDGPRVTPVLAGGVATISSTPCRRIGPFNDRGPGLALANKMARFVQKARVNEKSERQKLGYWVIIPQQSSRVAAERILQQLRQTGEQDVWLFRSGELENGLSLGLFAERGNAEKRREQIVARGFRAELRPRFREVSEYWLDIELRPDAIDVEQWLQQQPVKAEIRVVDCPS